MASSAAKRFGEKHFGTTDRTICMVSWMIAALRSEFGPLPVNEHEKTLMPARIESSTPFTSACVINDVFRNLAPPAGWR